MEGFLKNAAHPVAAAADHAAYCGRCGGRPEVSFGRRNGAALILSQVVLSLEPSLELFSLVMLTSGRRRLTRLMASSWLTAGKWPIAVLVALLTVKLLVDFV